MLRSSPSAAPRAESFGQTCGIDVHDHVDQRFHFRGFARLANESNLRGKLLEDRFRFLERFLASAAHQVKLALTRLRDARGHTCLKRLRASFLGKFFDLDVHLWRDGRAVDEQFAARVDQQIVTVARKDLPHRVVVRHNGEDDVGLCRYFRQILCGSAAKLRCERCGGCAVRVVNRRDLKTTIL